MAQLAYLFKSGIITSLLRIPVYHDNRYVLSVYCLHIHPTVKRLFLRIVVARRCNSAMFRGFPSNIAIVTYELTGMYLMSAFLPY